MTGARDGRHYYARTKTDVEANAQVAARHKRVPIEEREDTDGNARERNSAGSDTARYEQRRSFDRDVEMSYVRRTKGDSVNSVHADEWDVAEFLNLDELEHGRRVNLEPRNPRDSSNSDTILQDDPLGSLLDMDARDVSEFSFHQADVASISAALNTVYSESRGENRTDGGDDGGELNLAFTRAHARDHFAPKPSPLGQGTPALQYAGCANIPQNPKVQVPGDFFHGVPKRVVSKERQAQLDRYRAKRERRLLGLNKQTVRYDGRQKLANARVRVKGRFVKVSPEEKRAVIKSYQSCPDLSAMVDSASTEKRSIFADDSVKRSRREFGRSSDDSATSIDEYAMNRLDTVSTIESLDKGIEKLEPHVLNGLRRGLGQTRHSQSEICLYEFAGV